MNATRRGFLTGLVAAPVAAMVGHPMVVNGLQCKRYTVANGTKARYIFCFPNITREDHLRTIKDILVDEGWGQDVTVIVNDAARDFKLFEVRDGSI